MRDIGYFATCYYNVRLHYLPCVYYILDANELLIGFFFLNLSRLFDLLLIYTALEGLQFTLGICTAAGQNACQTALTIFMSGDEQTIKAIPTCYRLPLIQANMLLTFFSYYRLRSIMVTALETVTDEILSEVKIYFLYIW
jgi:hypothetical protein